jgi:ABC-type amino acid transport substrate-binding protein
MERPTPRPSIHRWSRPGEGFLSRQVLDAGKGFLEIPVGVAVAKGKHGDFLAKLNKGLKAIMVDGTYDRIIAKWGVPATTKPPKE